MAEWFYSLEYFQPCLIVERRRLWGEAWFRAWLPDRDELVRVDVDQIRPLASAPPLPPERAAHALFAARVAETLAANPALAAADTPVVPLPHQLRALHRAVTGDRVRFLLADAVGLGKTIEAGLILRELKLRGQVKRTLVVAPKGLAPQWVAEMEAHLAEKFRLLSGADLPRLRDLGGFDNPWLAFPQVVCSMDAVKPLEPRRGWSRERLDEYNRRRFADLMSARWDLIIVDEAHRLGGSDVQVARHQLGRGLAAAAPYLLLLSATPHQGKSDAFHRLLSLLDADAFPVPESVTRDSVAPYVIRTEKARAIDPAGRPLFLPRHTRLEAVAWQDAHRPQRELYEAVAEFVRVGLSSLGRPGRGHAGLLLLLLQRLVASSTHALHAALLRRRDALAGMEGDDADSLFAEQVSTGTPPEAAENEMVSSERPIDAGLSRRAWARTVNPDDWAEMDGDEQLDVWLPLRPDALTTEREALDRMLELATRAEQAGSDAKAEALLAKLYELQREENDPVLKALVFTEFRATQEMLAAFLAERGFAVAILHGGLSLNERQAAQRAFARDARILISTDAGGEGLNLQFCHVAFNYDLPWNPMRLEQRIGRVDRIGQRKPVRAFNFVLADTVEYRVREVLEHKLAVIEREMGADQTGDILASADAGALYETLYAEAMRRPDKIAATVKKTVNRLKEQILAARESRSLFDRQETLRPDETERLRAHPLPHWVEQLVIHHLRDRGGRAEVLPGGAWRLVWPDGTVMEEVVFGGTDAAERPAAQCLTLDHPQVRLAAMQLCQFAPGQSIPILASAPGDLSGIQGYWSLWRVELRAGDWHRQRMLPLFLHDDGRVLPPTAQRLWDALLAQRIDFAGAVTDEAAQAVFERMQAEAETHGTLLRDELAAAHDDFLRREREKDVQASAVRRTYADWHPTPPLSVATSDSTEKRRRKANPDNDPLRPRPELTALLLLRVGEPPSHA